MATTTKHEAAKTTKKTVAIPSRFTVREFADRLKLPVTEVLGVLLKSGMLSSQNELIDFETATIVAQDLGFETTAEERVADEAESPIAPPVTESKHRVPRPPVVVVLGHVDHGKTALLDAVRKTNVVSGEAGGITQHIGAYQVQFTPATPKPRARGKGKAKAGSSTSILTFIDTPGHEAFTAMRSRGAKVADLAVLVVAADDGVKPQTDEAITIIKAAGIPFVVAANKIDKPEANLEKLKQGLAARGMNPEDYGGKVIVVPVSAKTGEGVDALLEALALLAEVEHGKVVADPNAPAYGTIIESHLDPGEGPVATVLVQSGTLRVGDLVTVGNTYGKLKALKDDRGATITSAPPSFPARILGLKGAPVVGDILRVTDDVSAVRKRSKRSTVASEMKPLTTARKSETPTEAEVVNVVVKVDTLGSLEAIAEALNSLAHPEVRVDVVHSGLGSITETDVLRAAGSGALLLGFHVTVTPAARAVARGKDFTINNFTIIYHLVDFVRAAMEKKLKPEVTETLTGKLTILATFRSAGAAQIVGGRMESGSFTPKTRVRIRRGDAVVGEGTIAEIRQGKTVVKEVTSGSEVGLKLESSIPIAVGDILETVRVDSHTRTLG
jgi:translation initiation factor IF-2